MALDVDKQSPDFWRKLEPGAAVVLEDTQAIAESMRTGAGAYGIHYRIERRLKIRHENGLAEWLLFDLVCPDDRLWLMAKIVGSMVDLRIYFEQDDVFAPGTRADLINREDYWLFQEPDDPENFNPGELEYTLDIPWELDEGGEQFEVVYGLKPQGVLYGETRELPRQEGMPDDLFTTLAEYATEEECENPEVLVLELGGLDEYGELLPEGGFVQLFFGCQINASDIDVMPA